MKNQPDQQAVDRPDYVTVQFVADKILDVSARTVRNMIADGRLKSYTLGPRVVRLRLSEVEAALQPSSAN